MGTGKHSKDRAQFWTRPIRTSFTDALRVLSFSCLSWEGTREFGGENLDVHDWTLTRTFPR